MYIHERAHLCAARARFASNAQAAARQAEGLPAGAALLDPHVNPTRPMRRKLGRGSAAAPTQAHCALAKPTHRFGRCFLNRRCYRRSLRFCLHIGWRLSRRQPRRLRTCQHVLQCCTLPAAFRAAHCRCSNGERRDFLDLAPHCRLHI